MRFIHKLYLFAFIAILLLIFAIDYSSVLAKQSDSSSFIDYSDQEQSKGFYTDLDGYWNFFDKELLTPEEVKEQLRNGRDNVVSLPDSFEAQTGEINSFWTYSTTINVPEEYVGETLAVSAYTLYIDDTVVAKKWGGGAKMQLHMMLKWLRKRGILLWDQMKCYSRCNYLALTIFEEDLRIPFI